jgi:hypothetical protein
VEEKSPLIKRAEAKARQEEHDKLVLQIVTTMLFLLLFGKPVALMLGDFLRSITGR